jgi:2-polyprenyl-3-methyl-5-hydroxy-6-metoxy-1,4-benzoquinol methylase
VPLYQGLRDPWFGTPGAWNVKQCPNRGCGLLWLDPMPLEADLAQAYQGYYTHDDAPYLARILRRGVSRLIQDAYLAARYGYADRLRWRWQQPLGALLYLNLWHRPDLDFLVMHLPARSGGHLLEIGCGSGQMLGTLQALGWNVRGVDFDAEAAAHARRKGVSVDVGNVEEQGYPADHFDAVALNHVIEHVYDPQRVLQECHRILKPGGMLVLVTPNADSWGHRICRGQWRSLEPPRHLRVFRRRGLSTLTRAVGFRTMSAFTSSRESNGTFLDSYACRRTGRGMRGRRASVGLRLWARGMQLAEALLLNVRPDAGEEIVLLCEK